MKILKRPYIPLDSIVVIQNDGDPVQLRVVSSTIDAAPMMEPTVRLECVFDKLPWMDVKGKVPAAMRRKKVIYAPPATIVLWEDGTKTVVKCDEKDTYDPKYGLALCYMKKAMGNTSRALNDVLHEEEKHDE